MKILFLIFHGFNPSNGISKKVSYQLDAFKANGHEAHICYMDEKDTKRRMIDDQIIRDYGSGRKSKILKRIEFSSIVNYTISQKTDFVYIRSNHNANPFTIWMVKRMKKAGMKVVMEIPTYPYDSEYHTQGMDKQIFQDKLFRKSLAKQLDAIITFSDYDRIFGQRTIRISNGIDFKSIKMKSMVNDTSKELNLIGVAEIHDWHGFDRILKGLADYYSKLQEYTVRFHLVGYFFFEEDKNIFKQYIIDHHLDDNVILHGKMHGKELDELFEQCDFGIGSLGRHRVGIDKIKTLKNREYAARGIPFVYSETDTDFDQKPYVLKVPADETPIDINHIIQFYKGLSMTPLEIRESIRDLSWKNQMGIVLKNVFET